MLDSRSGWPWSVEEVARVLGDEVLAFDAITGLHAAGLVNRSGQLVCPSRAAARFRELERGAI